MKEKYQKENSDLQISKKAVIIIVLKVMERFALKIPCLDIFFTLDMFYFTEFFSE